MFMGIDVSRHNVTPDFAQARAAGVSFVYVKATEGRDYRDPMYQPHAWNALKAGLHLGFYHFARPDLGNKPEEEAQNFIDAISIFKYDLLPVLDLEVSVSMSDDELYNWAKAFIDTVKSKTGHNVMLYTGLYYLNEYPALKKLSTDEVPLWVAAYRETAPSISGWDWTMWQYSDKAEIPGIGVCDANKLADLAKILINPPKPKPKPKPAPAFKRYLKLTSPMMCGDDVKLVQKKLGVAVDGIYGPKTKAAVVAFQKKKGLQPDGIVGPKTWRALFQ